MKKFATMLSCICLAVFGAVVGLNNKSPAVTATAAPVLTTVPLDLRLQRMKYDTVYITKDSIIECKKNHYRKEVRVPYAVHDTLYVPVLYIATLRDRKESSQGESEYVIEHVDTMQAQKPLEIPDSVTVKPIRYL